MKKQLLLLLLTLLPMLAMADRRGECGDNVTWTYNESTWRLTIQGSGAMENCSSSSQPWYHFRTNIQTIVIKDGVTSIGAYAFSSCSHLTSITIPNSVTRIGYCAFEGCSGLTSVTIPNSVTSIEYGAFEGTAWFNNQPDGLVYAGKVVYKYKGEMPSNTSIIIKDGTLSIGVYAFQNCSGLTSVTIPNSVTSIGSSAFSGCSGLTSIKVENGNSKFDSRNNCNAIIETATNTLIVGCKNTIIPNSVTSIGGGAFSRCSSLTSITIPNSVTSIGSGAFEGTAWFNNQPDGLVYAGKVVYKYKGEMPSNTSIIIKDGTLGIGGGAFRGCSSLTSITIPNSVTSLGYSAFWGCSGLTSITIPNSVTSIGTAAFYDCSGLTSVTIGNSVTSIGGSAFSRCSGLTSITIPNSVTSIGTVAFYGCSGLTSIIIPNSVTSIGYQAFIFCSGLTSVTIGNSVTSIGEDAFYGCSGLKSVYSKIENVFAINGSTFSGYTYYYAKLYVPIGKKSAYQETEGWKEFYNIEEYDYSTGIAAPQQSKDAKIVDAYQLNGQKRSGLQRGLNIVRMSDGTTKKVVVK